VELAFESHQVWAPWSVWVEVELLSHGGIRVLQEKMALFASPSPNRTLTEGH
jgi:hypothetical protein